MNTSRRQLGILALTLALATVARPVWAEKPDDKGKDKGNDKYERKNIARPDSQAKAGAAVSFRFGDDERRVVSQYYGAQVKAGRCPPGLAKKGNGCQPPGQAKKWQRGQTLPADVRYQNLPADLRLRLPAPPPNHRYVQVAGDILLLAIGTSMVVDALENIFQ